VLDEVVVGGQAMDGALAQQIDAAVSDMPDEALAIPNEQRGASAARALLRRILHAELPEARIGVLERAAHHRLQPQCRSLWGRTARLGVFTTENTESTEGERT